MSTMDVASGLPRRGSVPAFPLVREVRAELAPWGFWGSLGWVAFASASGWFVVFVYAILWMLTHGLQTINPGDVAFNTVSGIAIVTAPLIVLGLAAKIRKYSLRDYFALDGFSRRDFIIGLTLLIALIVVFGAMQTLLGIEGGSKQVEAGYRAAKPAGLVPLLWFSVVVVAPVTEELFFRGFLHRGWVPSWLGVSGTIVLTSALWAVLHQQYNVFGILLIFVMGLIFGWMRQRSGSTLLPMALHTVNNLLAMLFVAIQVEWLS